MAKTEIVIFWMRRDLRLNDSAGLSHALQSGLPVLPVFIFDKNILDGLENKQDRRVDFIHKALLSLQEELAFLEHYMYLLKIRFGSSITFNITIRQEDKSLFLPPMCLQMLVENTIQHNETSQANPLDVNIYSENNCLIVTNPIQPRSDKAKSSQTGLKNMQVRYQFL